MKIGRLPQRSDKAPSNGTQINAINVDMVDDTVNKTWALSATCSRSRHMGEPLRKVPLLLDMADVVYV